MAKGLKAHRPYKWNNTTTIRFIYILLVLAAFAFAFGVIYVPVNRRQNEHVQELAIEYSTNHLLRNDEKNEQKLWMEIVSWKPRAFLFHNFLTKYECEYLINIAKAHMEKSTVVDHLTGKSMDSSVRTSTGTFLRRGQDEIISRIEKRIADTSFIPAENGEAIQILHYEVDQKYDAHHDYFNDPFNIKNGGNRVATMLMYLSDVEKGGETVFPLSKVNSSSVPWWDELSECGRSGLSVRPRMGDALFFWSMKPDASLDPMSLHGSCPVIQGNKWSATKWMHVNMYS